MMINQNPATVFNEKFAATYDQNAVKSAPMLEALRFLTRLVLAELPADARVLCVGVGTGTELFDLAAAFPDWQFTAVEPAPAMMEICRQRARENGVEERIVFHSDFLDSLPESAPFDAATCILVSHFFMQSAQRSEFFGQIAERLRNGAILVNADISSDMSAATFPDLLKVWGAMLKNSGMPAEQIEGFLASLGQNTAVLPVREVELIIEKGGFEAPVLFFQSLLIHGWFARKSG